MEDALKIVVPSLLLQSQMMQLFMLSHITPHEQQLFMSFIMQSTLNTHDLTIEARIKRAVVEFTKLSSEDSKQALPYAPDFTYDQVKKVAEKIFGAKDVLNSPAF